MARHNPNRARPGTTRASFPASASSQQTRIGPILPVILLSLCCVTTILLSVWSIRQENMVADYQARLTEKESGDPARRLLAETDLPDYPPARVFLLQAMSIARSAADIRDPSERQPLLSLARRYLDEARDVRPHWGEYWIVKAYIESLASNDFSTTERDALIQSYLDAPFLQTAGLWRTPRAMAQWRDFPPFAQKRIVEEAVVLIRTSDYPEKKLLLATTRNSDAYRAVFKALRRGAP